MKITTILAITTIVAAVEQAPMWVLRRYEDEGVRNSENSGHGGFDESARAPNTNSFHEALEDLDDAAISALMESDEPELDQGDGFDSSARAPSTNSFRSALESDEIEGFDSSARAPYTNSFGASRLADDAERARVQDNNGDQSSEFFGAGEVLAEEIDDNKINFRLSRLADDAERARLHDSNGEQLLELFGDEEVGDMDSIDENSQWMLESPDNELLDSEVEESPDNELLDNEVGESPDNELLDNEVEESPDNELLDNGVEESPDNELLDNEVEESPDNELLDNEVEESPYNELLESEDDDRAYNSVEYNILVEDLNDANDDALLEESQDAFLEDNYEMGDSDATNLSLSRIALLEESAAKDEAKFHRRTPFRYRHRDLMADETTTGDLNDVRVLQQANHQLVEESSDQGQERLASERQNPRFRH